MDQVIIRYRAQALTFEVEVRLSKERAGIQIQLGIGRVVELNVVLEPVEKGCRGTANQFGQAIAGQCMVTVVTQIDSADDPIFVPKCNSRPWSRTSLHVYSFAVNPNFAQVR
jgi:hypothetical protein